MKKVGELILKSMSKKVRVPAVICYSSILFYPV